MVLFLFLYCSFSEIKLWLSIEGLGSVGIYWQYTSLSHLTIRGLCLTKRCVQSECFSSFLTLQDVIWAEETTKAYVLCRIIDSLWAEWSFCFWLMRKRRRPYTQIKSHTSMEIHLINEPDMCFWFRPNINSYFGLSSSIDL